MLSLDALTPNPLATFTDFVGGLADMVVTGVGTDLHWDQPASLNTATLPAKWLELPKGDGQLMTFEGGVATYVMRINLWIAIAPVAQDGHERRFRAAVEMMDRLNHALSHEDLDTDEIAISKLTFTIRQTEKTVAGTVYTAVHALVQGRG